MTLKDRWRVIRPHLISGAMYYFARALASTMRMRVIGAPDDFAGKIICGWHGRTFAFANFWRNRDFWVIISHSRDGEMQKHIFERFGFQIIRGSTGRGGEKALVQAIRVLKKGGTMAMTPDGPRGPSGKVQDGVMVMAQKSGAALLPGAFSCRPRFQAGSWDRYMVPYPFAKGIVLFAEPIYVPKDASPEVVEELRLKLEMEMNRLEREAEQMMGFS